MLKRTASPYGRPRGATDVRAGESSNSGGAHFIRCSPPILFRLSAATSFVVHMLISTAQICRREIRIRFLHLHARQAPVEKLMTIRLTNQAALDSAVRRLIKRDARLKPVLAVSGMPALQARPAGFEGLAQIVCGRQ